MKRRIVSLAATAAVCGAGMFAVAGGLTAAASSAASSLPTLKIALTPKTVTVSGSEVSGAVNVLTTVTGEKSDSPGLVLLAPG